MSDRLPDMSRAYEILDKQHQLQGQRGGGNASRILVRLPSAIHEMAKRAAKREGVCLNAYCIAALTLLDEATAEERNNA
jgi:predicted HicB family RNase H-like nuclease